MSIARYATGAGVVALAAMVHSGRVLADSVACEDLRDSCPPGYWYYFNECCEDWYGVYGGNYSWGVFGCDDQGGDAQWCYWRDSFPACANNPCS